MTSPSSDLGWLYRALSWMSPAWPIGAFAFSSGLEWAHEAGWLSDGDAVEAWLRDSLKYGALNSESVIFVHCWQAAQGQEPREALHHLAELAMASQGSAERTLETSAQGSAFRRIALAANRDAYPLETTRYESALSAIGDDDLPYALAAAVLFAAFEMPLEQALTAYLHAALSNLLSAAQRIVPLGHTESQILLARLETSAANAASRATIAGDLPLEQALSSATLAADIACMRHETQYTRLFRT